MMLPREDLEIQPLRFYVSGGVSGYYGYRGDVFKTMDMYILVHV